MTKSTTSANAAVEQMRRTTGHLTCTLTGCGGEQTRPRDTAGRGSGGPGGVVKEANISDATQELGLGKGSRTGTWKRLNGLTITRTETVFQVCFPGFCFCVLRDHLSVKC